jgi:hypothetical protein
VLTHRATGYIVANQTGDIADHHYYLYKQGWLAQASLLFLRDSSTPQAFQFAKIYVVVLMSIVPDIARIAALGVKACSFSISWPRVMPFDR